MKEARHKRSDKVGLHLSEAPRTIKLIETKIGWWVPRSGESGLVFNGNNISAVRDEKVLKVDDDDGRTRMRTCSMPLNIKVVEMVHLVLCTLQQLKNKM